MSRDPYRYFRVEARELLEGLERGVLELERAGDADLTRKLLRLAHTLKGAARVVRLPPVAEAAHRVEALLEPHRDGAAGASRTTINSALAELDIVRKALAELEGIGRVAPAMPADRPASEVQQLAEEELSTVRVAIADVDGLLDGVLGAQVALEALAEHASNALRGAEQALKTARRELAESGTRSHALEALSMMLHRGADEAARRHESGRRELDELRADVAAVRLLPVSAIVADLERAVRDAAQLHGKTVTFSTRGAELRLDAHVLATLRGALLHVVRNCVAHGVESPAVRAAAGKPATGSVEVSVRRQGQRACFTIQDDGAGIDATAVRRAAVARGVLSLAQAQAMGERELVAVLMRGGVSTSERVDEIAGRGIGLDSVRSAVAQLKGQLRIESSAASGTEVEITVPVSLVALPALVVESSGVVSLIPLDAVRETLRLPANSPASADRSLVSEGNVIPLRSLDHALRRSTNHATARSAVVVSAGDARVAMAVDRVLGVRTVVVEPMPGAAHADPVVAGAAFDHAGRLQLVLAPAALVERTELEPIASSAAPRAPVLVIDDSLTTRMLEQSILVSAGFEVELAASAEEGLEKARQRRYGLFLVDVEMPGMDGFEFVAATRADPVLRETPAIIVSSRNAPEDKKRGKQVGARGYIVKGEFDQQALLETVRRLIGVGA